MIDLSFLWDSSKVVCLIFHGKEHIFERTLMSVAQVRHLVDHLEEDCWHLVFASCPGVLEKQTQADVRLTSRKPTTWMKACLCLHHWDWLRSGIFFPKSTERLAAPGLRGVSPMLLEGGRKNLGCVINPEWARVSNVKRPCSDIMHSTAYLGYTVHLYTCISSI